VVDTLPADEPDLIWLPNTIITGTRAGEDPPLRRLRGGRDLWTLRLFIDLYHAQNLRDDGGVSPTVLFQVFDRKRVGEFGIFNVWGFRAKPELIMRYAGPLAAHESRPSGNDGRHPVWESVDNLKKHGLLKFVPHLWDDEYRPDNCAEIIHPYGVMGAGEPEELEISRAAHCAALLMVQDFQLEKASGEGYHLFAPIQPKNGG
jgi:hypothetical protein